MRLWRVRSVRAGALLLAGVSRYRGSTTTLADGTVVRHGARILHLHLDNGRVRAEAAARTGGLALVPALRADLEVLGSLVREGRYGKVVAVRGVTVLAPAARRFGFEVRPLPHNLRWFLVHELARVVAAAYGRGGPRDVRWPGEVWMSAAALSSMHFEVRERAHREP